MISKYCDKLSVEEAVRRGGALLMTLEEVDGEGTDTVDSCSHARKSGSTRVICQQWGGKDKKLIETGTKSTSIAAN